MPIDVATQKAEAADKLAAAASNHAEAVGRELEAHKDLDTLRFQTIEKTLGRIEDGVAGLYRRWWSFLVGLIIAIPPVLVGAATLGFWLGGKIK